MKGPVLQQLRLLHAYAFEVLTSHPTQESATLRPLARRLCNSERHSEQSENLRLREGKRLAKGLVSAEPELEPRSLTFLSGVFPPIISLIYFWSISCSPMLLLEAKTLWETSEGKQNIIDQC